MKKYALFLLLALTAYAQQERVAIIQTLDNNDSISFNDLSYLTDKLRETAVKILPNERFGVMTTESIIAFLGSQERAVKVCNESSCLAELGRMVSADYVAQGRVGRFGKDLTIKVELYNVKTGTLMDSFTGDSKDIYGLRDIISEKAPDLFKKMLATQQPKPVATTPPPEPVTPPPTPKPDTPPAPKEVPPEESEAPELGWANIHSLLEFGFEENEEEIKKLSSSLSLSNDEKLFMFNKHKKKYAVWLALANSFYGLGSYLQGNIIFGLVQSALEIGGNILSVDHKYNSYKTTGAVMIGSGIAIGLVAPFVYQYRYNKRLKEALNIDENISLSIDPLIIPRDGTPAVGLAFNVRY